MNTPWKLGLGAVAFVLIAAGLVKSCGFTESLVIPDWADSLRAEQVRSERERDSLLRFVAHWQQRADSSQGVAQMWRQRASIRPVRPHPEPRDSSRSGSSPVMTDSSGFTGDSAAYIGHLLAANDSLWTALDASDSAFMNLEQAYSKQRQATASAMAGWAAADTALARERAVALTAIGNLTASLRKAQRGCRVLGLLPCPTVSAGAGATLAGGKVSLGPTVGIVVPLRF